MNKVRLLQNYIASATWGRRENVKYEKHETDDFATKEYTSPRYTDSESPARVFGHVVKQTCAHVAFLGMHAGSCEWRDARRAHVRLNVRVAVFGDGRAHSVALVDSVGGDPDD